MNRQTSLIALTSAAALFASALAAHQFLSSSNSGIADLGDPDSSPRLAEIERRVDATARLVRSLEARLDFVKLPPVGELKAERGSSGDADAPETSDSGPAQGVDLAQRIDDPAQPEGARSEWRTE